MQTRVRRLHTKTADGETSIVLEISGPQGGGDRANLNAWLGQRASVSARSVSTGRSSASAQSKCSTDSATAASGSGHASVRGAGSELEMGERD